MQTGLTVIEVIEKETKRFQLFLMISFSFFLLLLHIAVQYARSTSHTLSTVSLLILKNLDCASSSLLRTYWSLDSSS